MGSELFMHVNRKSFSIILWQVFKNVVLNLSYYRFVKKKKVVNNKRFN